MDLKVGIIKLDLAYGIVTLDGNINTLGQPNSWSRSSVRRPITTLLIC